MTTDTVKTLTAAPRLLARRFVGGTKTSPSGRPICGRSVDAPHNVRQDSEARAGEVRPAGIVCGTDFSIHAREAADVAAALAGRLSCPVTLAHIVEPARGDATSKSLNAMLRFRGRNRLKKEAERLRAFGTAVEEAFSSGAPAVELVRSAITDNAQLIVVSSVGSLLPTRWLLGSVAEQTAQLAPVPVLVVRDPKPFKAWASGKRSLNILVGHDFSTSSDAALDWVAGLRRIGRCRITVAHFSTPQLTTGWLEVDAKPGSRKRLVEIREMLRGDLIQKCRGPLGKARFQVEVVPIRDSVAARLVGLAKARSVDLIVVGTNQKGTLRRLCLGSVSRGVLQEALVSVACVPMASNPCC